MNFKLFAIFTVVLFTVIYVGDTLCKIANPLLINSSQTIKTNIEWYNVKFNINHLLSDSVGT